MMFTNAAIQAIVNEVGKDRINSMSFNSGKLLLIGYESGTQWEDLSFKTYDGVDCIVVHHKQQQGGRVIEWDNIMVTEFLENIEVMSEGYDQYRIDPLIMKA